jgi:hypothetical protein
VATKRDGERDNRTGEDGEAKCRSATRASSTVHDSAGWASYRTTAQHEKQQLLLSIAHLTCDSERPCVGTKVLFADLFREKILFIN